MEMNKYFLSVEEYIRLNEGISEKDMDKALDLILKFLRGKIGKIYEMPGSEEVERGGKNLIGIHYLTVDGKGIRFNWEKSASSEEIHSVDFYDVGNLMEPHITLELNGDSLARILPGIVEVYYKMSTKVEFVDESFEYIEIVGEARTQGSLGKKTVKRQKAKLKYSPKEEDVTPATKKAQSDLDGIKYADPDTVFEDTEAFVQMVIDGIQPSLIITGLPGVGKTFGVEQMMKKNGLQKIEPIELPEDASPEDLIDAGIKLDEETPGDWVHIKGKATALAVYGSLYKYKSKIIVFDDCDSVWKNKETINILKGALDSSEKRTISWRSSSTMGPKAIAPPAFEFKGGVIFISNLYMKDLDSAIRSRSYVIDITLRAEDIILRIKSILPKIKVNDKVTMKHKEMSLKFMEEYAKDHPGFEISIRSLMAFSKVIASGFPNWERMLKLQAENMTK